MQSVCPVCGRLNPESARFCLYCGGNLSISETRYIDPEEYEHPLDREAQNFIDSTVFLPALLKLASNLVASFQRITAIGHYVKVSEKNYPRVQKLVLECAERLSLPRLPEVYVSGSLTESWSAYSIGTDERPIIVIGSEVVSNLDADELKFVIGHEFGHIKSNHLVYTTALYALANFTRLGLEDLLGLPAYIVGNVLLGVTLSKWLHASEFTCDRTGLICSGKLDASQKALLKIHLRSKDVSEVDVDSYVSQVDQEITWSFLVKLAELGQTQPFMPYRLRELKTFYNSQVFHDIIAKLNSAESGQTIPVFANRVYYGGLPYRKGNWLERTVYLPREVKSANLSFKAVPINDPWIERHATLELNGYRVLDDARVKVREGVAWSGDVTPVVKPGPNTLRFHIDSAGFRWRVSATLRLS